MTTRPIVGRTTNFWLLDDICLLTKKLQMTNANVEKRKRQKKYQKMLKKTNHTVRLTITKK